MRAGGDSRTGTAGVALTSAEAARCGGGSPYPPIRGRRFTRRGGRGEGLAAWLESALWTVRPARCGSGNRHQTGVIDDGRHGGNRRGPSNTKETACSAPRIRFRTRRIRWPLTRRDSVASDRRRKGPGRYGVAQLVTRALDRLAAGSSGSGTGRRGVAGGADLGVEMARPGRPLVPDLGPLADFAAELRGPLPDEPGLTFAHHEAIVASRICFRAASSARRASTPPGARSWCVPGGTTTRTKSSTPSGSPPSTATRCCARRSRSSTATRSAGWRSWSPAVWTRGRPAGTRPPGAPIGSPNWRSAWTPSDPNFVRHGEPGARAPASPDRAAGACTFRVRGATRATPAGSTATVARTSSARGRRSSATPDRHRLLTPTRR